jgi:predicted FMN-binding regulatory protein PaiB
MSAAEALQLLEQAPYVHLSAVLPNGRPLLRTINAAVLDGYVVFHGAAAGEKLEAVGRPVVLAAEEHVAQLPSWFTDDERACPASTLYRSVQVHGVLEQVDAPGEKALAVEALMNKHQPEGRHRPLDADSPLYKKELAAIWVARVPLTQVDGKSKLAQNRSPAERAKLLEQLWKRGAPADLRAVDLVLKANPGTPLPPFLAAPAGLSLVCAPGPAHLAEAAALVEGAYWNQGLSRGDLEQAHASSSAWVAGLDERGALVATGRAISDSVKWAGVYDVMVAEPWRKRGVASALMRLLLDHPAVRAVRTVWLRTRDAQPLYRRFGFVDDRTFVPPGRTYASTEMLLRR